MSRFFGFVFAACLLAICTSTAVPAANPDWPKSLTLGTASPGGVYYDYGEAVAKILTEKLGIDVNPLPTQGPVHNVKLIVSGGAQLGLVTMGVALQAWNGTADWENPPEPCARSFRCTILHFKLRCFAAPQSPALPCWTSSTLTLARAPAPGASTFQRFYRPSVYRPTWDTVPGTKRARILFPADTMQWSGSGAPLSPRSWRSKKKSR